MLSMMGGMAQAQQNIYVHVEQQVGTETTVSSYAEASKLGTAVFSNANTPTVEFKNGKAVMTINGVDVAKLPMSNGGRLVVEHSTTTSSDDLHKVTKKYTEGAKYITIYSPFQIVIPSEGCEVYAPTYSPDDKKLRFSASNKLDANTIVPAETALMITNHSTNVDFSFSTESSASYSKDASSLTGTSLKIANPKDDSHTVYTFGFGKEDPYKSQFGLFKFVGSYLNPGACYLSVAASTSGTAAAKYIPVSFDGGDDVTGIQNVNDASEATANGKFVENGRIVVKKAGKKYNLNGQEVM